jgi:phosphonopyruvate decarboxylase
MIDPDEFVDELKEADYTFFSGVPCSFLKGLINAAISRCEYIAATNEGDAVAVCAGACLGGRKTVLIMQNSGLTNAISPLTSLNFPFAIPTLGFVSLRGEKDLNDEPQHELMGSVTTAFLDLMQISWAFLSPDTSTAKSQLQAAYRILDQDRSFFFLVRKNTFSDRKPACRECAVPETGKKTPRTGTDSLPLRADVIRTILSARDDNTAVIATTGFTGRELCELGDSENNFYMVGSMGCAGSVGLGLSLAKPEKTVMVIDGDGALLMRMGSMAAIGHYPQTNLLHIVLDNHSYESTGCQKTVSDTTDLVEIASACGYAESVYIHDPDELHSFLTRWKKARHLTFLYVKIREGTLEDLKRPSVKPPFVKKRFMEFLHG